MAVAAYNSNIYVTSSPSVAFTNEATTASADRKVYTISNQTKRLLDRNGAVVVESSPDGTTWTTVSSGFTLRYIGAKVIFASAQPVGTHIRFASGKYYSYAALAGANTTEFEGEVNLEEVTDYASAGAKTFLPTTMSAMLTCGTFWVDHARVKNLQDRELLVGSFVLPTGRHLEGYMYVGECGIKAEIDAAVTQDLKLQLTDQFFSQN